MTDHPRPASIDRPAAEILGTPEHAARVERARAGARALFGLRLPSVDPAAETGPNAARPRWFLRENVPNAPDIKPAGYDDVRSFLLDHSTLDRGDGVGHEQMRRRRFWFGTRDQAAPELRAHLAFALEVLPDRALTCDAEIDGAERIAARRTMVSSTTAGPNTRDSGKRKQTVSGRHEGAVGAPGIDYSARYSLDEMLDLQGLPRDLFEHSPLTVHGRRKFVGNAVPLPMAEQLARAIREALS